MRTIGFFVLSVVSVNAFAAGGTFTLGKNDSEVSEIQKTYKPITEVMATAIGKQPNMVIAPDWKKLTAEVEAKKIDVMIDSLFNFVVLGKGEIVPTLTYWKKGKEEYAGCIYVKAGSSIASIKDLQGKKIASEDELSTSTFALPAYTIVTEVPKAKLKVLALKEVVSAGKAKNELEAFRSAQATADAYNFAFTGDDATTEAWVLNGAADAGTGPCGDVEKKAELKVVARSPLVPRALVGFGKHVAAAERTKVEEALIKLTADSEALKSAGKATKVERIKPNHQASIDKVLPVFTKIAEMVGYK